MRCIGAIRRQRDWAARAVAEKQPLKLAAMEGLGQTTKDAPFDIGLHGLSEMFVDGFLDLISAGVLKREVDGTLLQAGFFLGARAFYRALREMPQIERAGLMPQDLGAKLGREPAGAHRVRAGARGAPYRAELTRSRSISTPRTTKSGRRARIRLNVSKTCSSG